MRAYITRRSGLNIERTVGMHPGFELAEGPRPSYDNGSEWEDTFEVELPEGFAPAPLGDAVTGPDGREWGLCAVRGGFAIIGLSETCHRYSVEADHEGARCVSGPVAASVYGC